MQRKIVGEESVIEVLHPTTNAHYGINVARGTYKCTP